MPKVSVIIPVYNVEQYLAAAIESVVNQTENDIEILLVNDGSTDESGRLCDEFAAHDARVKVVHKVNGGLSSARNAGVEVATSKYVLLLDGDDYLHPQAVERLIGVLNEYPSDVVQFFYQEVEKPIALPELSKNPTIAQVTTAWEAFERLYAQGGVYASGCTKLFRRELLLEIPFESIRHEDEMWCTRAFPRNLTITYIPDVLYGYVTREGSIIHSTFKKSRMDILTIRQERLKALQALGFSDLETKEKGNLFAVLFTLYKDAKKAKDKVVQQEIVQYFKKSKLLKQVKIVGRMKIFYLLAKISIKISLNVYATYWRTKN